MRSAFIDDGYTCEDVPIRGEGKFADFTISYRPMMGGERRRLALGMLAADQSGDNDRMVEWEQRTLKAVAACIKSWTLKDNRGKPVRITAENLARMPDAFDAIYNLVAGYSMPADEGEESQEEADQKNSNAG